MIVEVLVVFANPVESLAAVVRNLKNGFYLIHAVDIFRVGEDFVVIVTAGLVIAHLVPARSTVARTKESAFVVCSFGDCINNGRIHRRLRESDAPEIYIEET